MTITYTDSSGSVSTQVENFPSENGSSHLWMEIEGVSFSGVSFDDFHVDSYKKHAAEKLERFTFNEYINSTNPELDTYYLCNCRLDISIPVTVIKTNTQEEFASVLNVSLELGLPSTHGALDYESAIFSLHLEQEYFQGSESADFEEGLDHLRSAMGKKYHFKNCYGCLYSDYSPYGHGFFNSLMCFKKQKKAYLDLSAKFSKSDYFKVIKQGYSQVQEIYCCPSFEMRLPKTGYRGY
jgi:hypothetical protein